MRKPANKAHSRPANLLLCLVLLLLGSCWGKRIETDDFSSSQWKEDPNGCKGIRETMVEGLATEEEELVLLTENDIRYTLGVPDRKRLFERGQKFYIYFVESGTQCDDPQATKTGNYIEIRFNALNQVSEITYQQGQ